MRLVCSWLIAPQKAGNRVEQKCLGPSLAQEQSLLLRSVLTEPNSQAIGIRSLLANWDVSAQSFEQ